MSECEKYFGKTIILDGPVICNDGTTFDDYTWEEHLYYLFGIKQVERDDSDEMD